MRSGKIFRLGGLFLGILFLFVSCQDIFTTSAFSWAATPLSEMSGEQQVAYAEEVAKSGDSDAMAEAFTAIADDVAATTAEEDPDLYLLASDLAMGGSGLPDAITEVVGLLPDIDDLSEAELTAEIDTIIEGIDPTYLEDSVALFTEVSTVADAADDITESQYTNAAVAQIFIIYEEVGAENVTTHPDYAQAEAWATLGGLDAADFTDMLGAS